MICYGVADAIASITSGVAIKRLGRVPIFVFGAVVNLTLLVTFLYWRPDPNQPAVYFVIAALWGTADAIWQTQINGMKFASYFLHMNSFINLMITLYYLKKNLMIYFSQSLMHFQKLLNNQC